LKISAVVPAYNAAAFIGQALASIQQQSTPIDEIIVVDDGSSDDTEAIVRSCAPEALYISQCNQGPSVARNRGIEAASGEWIAFLDADDQWTREKTTAQLSVLKKHPELRLIASDMKEVDAHGNEITASVLAKHQQQAFYQALNGAPLPNALARLVTKNFIPTGTVLVQRQALLQAGLFNPHIRFGEDLELWAKIACHHPMTCLPAIHMLRRQHATNTTTHTGPMLKDLTRVMESIATYGHERLKQQGISPSTLIASALADLGYWQFSQANYREARHEFIHSLRVHLNKRALLYAIVCLLPSKLITEGKALKQRLNDVN
jgi:hypothetical protein